MKAIATSVLTKLVTLLHLALPGLVADVLLLAGAVSVSYGAWLVYAPAGFIVAGLLLLAAGWLAAQKAGA
jgi:hypothetical protein